MDLDGTLARGRAMAEARMRTRSVVMRKTGDHVLVNRLKVPEWAAVHVDLPFRLDDGATAGATSKVTIGDVIYENATAVGHMPAATRDLEDDDLILITTGEWADTVWRVVKATLADQKTARRLPIEQAPRPEEWA